MTGPIEQIGLLEMQLDESWNAFSPSAESAYYPRLCELAGDMGGTHVVVLRVTRAPRMIVDLVAGVYRDTPIANRAPTS